MSAPTRLVSAVLVIGSVCFMASGAEGQATATASPTTGATPTGSTETSPERPARAFAAASEVTVIDVRVDVRDASGLVPADLGPADFELREDGEIRPVVAVSGPRRPRDSAAVEPASGGSGAPSGATVRQAEALEEPWQIVVYFDLPLSAVQTVGRVANELAEQAEMLTGLGHVEVVVADPSPQVELVATRDPAKLRSTLEKLAKKRRGGEQIVAIRRDFKRSFDPDDQGRMNRFRQDPDAARPRPGVPGGGGPPGAPGGGGGIIVDRTGNGPGVASGGARNDAGRPVMQRQVTRNAVAQEVALLTRQRALLADWVAMVDRGGPKALLLVADGWDVDPADYYLASNIEGSVRDEIEAELRPYATAGATQTLADLLAAGGWRVEALATGNLGAAGTNAAEESGGGRFKSLRDSRVQSQGASNFYFRSPFVPLAAYADTTGGTLTTDPGAIGSNVSRLGDVVTLSFQVSRPPDGKGRKLEVVAKRPGLVVTAPRLVAAIAPDALLAARARHLLATPSDRGELVVQAVFSPTASGDVAVMSGTVDAKVELGALAAARATMTAASLRVTVALELPDGRVSISQQTARGVDVSSLAAWAYSAPLRAPAGTKKLAVVVDELGTGMWGGAAIELAADPTAKPRRASASR